MLLSPLPLPERPRSDDIDFLMAPQHEEILVPSDDQVGPCSHCESKDLIVVGITADWPSQRRDGHHPGSGSDVLLELRHRCVRKLDLGPEGGNELLDELLTDGYGVPIQAQLKHRLA